MNNIELRPPLPPPLSHSGITFVFGSFDQAFTLSPATVCAIAAALTNILPAGELSVAPDGRILCCSETVRSIWHQTGLLEGLERAEIQ